jgi:ankyrin repeat protein
LGPALLDSQSDNGFTPPQAECFAGQVAANPLLDMGANVKLTNKFRVTPLHRAGYVH